MQFLQYVTTMFMQCKNVQSSWQSVPCYTAWFRCKHRFFPVGPVFWCTFALLCHQLAQALKCCICVSACVFVLTTDYWMLAVFEPCGEKRRCRCRSCTDRSKRVGLEDLSRRITCLHLFLTFRNGDLSVYVRQTSGESILCKDFSFSRSKLLAVCRPLPAWPARLLEKCEQRKERCWCFLCEFCRVCSPLGCGLSGSLSVCFYLLHVPLWVLAIINKAIITNESVHVSKRFETNRSRLAELLVNIFAFDCIGPY